MRVLLVALIALATAAGTVTLCKARVTEGLREFLRRLSPFTRDLISCLYCTSHWVSAMMVLLFAPVEVAGLAWYQAWPLLWLTGVTLAAPGMWLINWAHSSMQWPDDSE